MMNYITTGALQLLPLTAGVDVVSNVKNSILDIFSAIGLIIVGATLIKNLSGGRKIALIGGLILGVFVLAAIGSLDLLTEWFKKIFTNISGVQWN